MIFRPDAAANRNVQHLLAFNQHLLEMQSSGDVARPLRRLGVVGAGLMGQAITGAAIAHGLPTTVFDVNQDALARLRQTLSDENTDTDGLLRITVELDSVADCDLVLESVPENLMLKRKLYAQLWPHLASGAVLATNTSTIPIARLSVGLTDASRFCGLHFFPLREWSLVEVVRGLETSPATMATALQFVERLGMLPMPVSDGPGFIVNRLMLLYINEAMQLLMEGATVEAVDRAAEEFGMALGPLKLVDAVGVDTTLDCAWSFCGAFPDIVPNSPLLVELVKAKRLGRKSDAGFYRYRQTDGQTIVQSDPTACELIARRAEPRRDFAPETIITRLFMAMVMEAVRMLQSGAVDDPRLIDLGVVRALGFPERLGGVLFAADAIGATALLEELQPLQALGPRFSPEPLLTLLARDGKRFYDLTMFSTKDVLRKGNDAIV